MSPTYAEVLAALRAGHAVAFAAGHVDGDAALAWIVAPLTTRQRRRVCRSSGEERAAFALGACSVLHDRYRLAGHPR